MAQGKGRIVGRAHLPVLNRRKRAPETIGVGDIYGGFGLRIVIRGFPAKNESVSNQQMPRRKRSRLRTVKPNFHHNVYVVLLSKATLKEVSVLARNPNRDPRKPAVYVGMTGLPVDHRFENHKNGYKSARLVQKYGVRLLPQLFEYLNPMPYEHAVQMEKDLAEDLRAQGYTVVGGT